MTDEVGYPLAIDGLITIKRDGPDFFEAFEGQKWAQPSEAHLRQVRVRLFVFCSCGGGGGQVLKHECQRPEVGAALRGTPAAGGPPDIVCLCAEV